MKKNRLPKSIRNLVLKAANAVKPIRVILFGSYAYGEPNSDSDVDLLFILDNSQRKLTLAQRYSLVSSRFFPRLAPFEFVVRTESEISERRKEFDPFLDEVMSQGIVLYER